MFDIELLGRVEGEGEHPFSWGQLTLGHFREEFQAPLCDWAPGDYAAHWLESARRLLQGAPVAVFLTHMARPDAAYHVGWPSWREAERIYVQERLFLREQLNGTFDPEYPEVHAGSRQEMSEEGERISQWDVTLGELAEFVERRKGSSVHA
jgi:contact-dependent growth inhibition (CDI) system CdiI-like immunity protein